MNRNEKRFTEAAGTARRAIAFDAESARGARGGSSAPPVQTLWADCENCEVFRRRRKALWQGHMKRRSEMALPRRLRREQRCGPPMTVKEMNRGDRVSRPERGSGPAHLC